MDEWPSASSLSLASPYLADAQHPAKQKDNADPKGQDGGEGRTFQHGLGATAFPGHAQQGRARPWKKDGDQPRGPDRQVLGRAEEGVQNGGKGGGVEAVDGGQRGHEREGHALLVLGVVAEAENGVGGWVDACSRR